MHMLVVTVAIGAVKKVLRAGIRQAREWKNLPQLRLCSVAMGVVAEYMLLELVFGEVGAATFDADDRRTARWAV